MRPGLAGTARRYARALLDVAGPDAALLRTELRVVVGVLRGSRELAAALDSPVLPADRKQTLLRALWGETASPLMLRLLDLLVANRRTPLLPAIEEAYGALLNEQRGVVAAEATSAEPVPDAQRKALEAAIAALTGRAVELRLREDPAILGGVVLNMQGRTYDGSERGQLHALRQRLGGATAGAA